MSAFWHPFANMAAVAGHELMIERGEGVYVYDVDGRRYLDGTASLWYANVGYGRREIAEAVANQLLKMHAFHTFGDFSSRPAELLSQRIAGYSPDPGSKVFLTSGGSDSVDSAAKLARRYFAAIGEPERTVFIVRDWAYHGMHAYGTSLAGMEPNREGTGPLIENVVKVPYDSIDALADAIEEVGRDRLAAFFCEPVIGAGGVRPAPPGYLEKARSMVADSGALYVSDEVITGFGRLGDWFAANRFDLQPDIMIFAKGVTSGYAPLGGIVVTPKVAAPFWQGDGAMWRHGYTYSGHTASCVAALMNLDIVEREGILQRARALEATLFDALNGLRDHPLVDHVRGGVGVMAAVQLDPEAVAADAGLAARAAAATREAGVITRAIAGGGLQASPPLTITQEHIEELVAGFRAGLDTLRAG